MTDTWVEPSFEHRPQHDLPDGWSYVALANLGVWGSGGTPTKSRAEYWERGTVPWVSPKDMKVSVIADAQDHITNHAVASGAATMAPPGTLLFVVRGMILAHTFPVAITSREVAFNQDMRSIVPKAGVHGPYLLRVLQHEAVRVLFAVKEATHGTLRLDSETLKPWPIPLPPLAEQRRIVGKVEELLAQVSAAKDRLAKIPAILKRLRQSVLAAACSGKLTEDWRTAEAAGAAATEGHDLPPGWKTMDLGSLIHGFEAGRNLRAEGRPATGREYAVLKISAVTWGVFRPDENKALLPGDSPRPHEVVRAGDLLISRANTSELVGAAVLVDRDYPRLMLPDKVLRLKVRDSMIDRRYLLHALRSKAVRDHFSESATGTSDSMRNLAQPKIGAAPIAVPPIAEQREIARRIEAVFAGLDALEQQIATGLRAAERLPQTIFAKAFLGELVPTEAELARVERRDYETAEQILDRVRATATSAGSAAAATVRRRRNERAPAGSSRRRD